MEQAQRIEDIDNLQSALERSGVPKPQPNEQGPKLSKHALYGLAGDFVRMVEPHSEADPVALLIQFLVFYGNVIGRSAYYRVEADRHYMNLYATLVGNTASGRKGTSLGHVRNVYESVDEIWVKERIPTGLSSGEGLKWNVRDPIEDKKPVKSKGTFTGQYETVITDHGIEDKRLLIVESEFASTLQVMGRQNSTLSPTLRAAWDTGNLKTLTKNDPCTATGAHVSLIGHITKRELLRCLDSTEAGNGFGNRFLWVCVKRSKCLPEGGNFHTVDIGPFVKSLTEAVEFASQAGELTKDENTRRQWAQIYPDLSAGEDNLLGSMVARAEAQVLRLACIYALLDSSTVIRVEHLIAAVALWEYCEQSARFIFGDALGDPVADEILKALQQCDEGMTRTEINHLFGRHKKSNELSRALEFLAESGRITSNKEETDGRPVERFYAKRGLNSHYSPNSQLGE